MLSLIVYLFFFFLLFLITFKDSEKSFIALLLGLLFFPATAVAFIKSPFLDPKTVYLYSFLFMQFVRHFARFKQDLKEMPLKIPLFLILSSYLLTSIFSSSYSPKNIYSAVRIFIDIYGFLLVAYIAGKHYDYNRIIKMLFFPIMFMFGLGLLEYALADNYPFKIISSAFPVFNGYGDLLGTYNFNQSWRSRICITTKHPTTLATLFCVLFLFFLPYRSFNYLKKTKLLVLLFAIAIIIYLSGSRTALFASIGLAVVYFILKQNLKIQIILIGIILLSASSYTYYIINKLNQKGQGSSLELRQEQLLFSLIEFSNAPYFGNGLSYVEKSIVEEENGSQGIGGLESIVFILLINQGLYGFFTYLFFLGYLIFFFFRRRKSTDLGMQGFLITSGAMLCFIASGHIGANETMSYVFIGLLLGAINNSNEKDEEALINKAIP